MPRRGLYITMAAALLVASACLHAQETPRIKAPSSRTSAANLTPEKIAQRTVERRAIEAVNWGMPAVNYDRMYLAVIQSLKGGQNQIVYWSALPDWKNQTLTPNPDTIYFQPFFNTENGPIVIEIPPQNGGSITGTIMDAWQAPLEDVGPAGVDTGLGGKYLITPPGYDEQVPLGYIVLPSNTYRGYALLRSTLRSPSSDDVARAVAYGKKIKLYPLADADSPPPTKFLDAKGVEFDSTIPYDIRFFESLNRVIQEEPWIPRDKVMIDMLRTIGIEQGKPFAPDPKTKAILENAAREAHAWLDTRYETGFPPYFEGTHWAVPAPPELMKTVATLYETPDLYSVDARGLTDYWAFSTIKHLGAGQFYLMSTKDKSGRPLDGSKTYRLVVPAKAPVAQYWSAVVYDRATHALIRDMDRASRSSQSEGLKRNDNGSVTVYFGPKAPEGKASNWIPTKPGAKFEVLFRLYGPQKPLFDKSWKLPDIAQTN